MITRGIPKFPTLEQVKEGIDNIMKEGWNNIKYENDPDKYRQQFDKYFIDKIGLLPYIVQQMKGSEFQWPVYRMRRFDNTIKPELISE